jgi:hypothetical protein
MGRRGTGAGTCLTSKGYLQVTRRGPDRNKLAHRMIMAAMCRESCYWPLGSDGLPPGMEVHHQDFDRTHNCPSNLVLLNPSLHLHMDRAPRSNRDRLAYGQFGKQPNPPVGSIIQHTVFHCPDCGRIHLVPMSWHSPEDVPDWVLEGPEEEDMA